MVWVSEADRVVGGVDGDARHPGQAFRSTFSPTPEARSPDADLASTAAPAAAAPRAPQPWERPGGLGKRQKPGKGRAPHGTALRAGPSRGRGRPQRGGRSAGRATHPTPPRGPPRPTWTREANSAGTKPRNVPVAYVAEGGLGARPPARSSAACGDAGSGQTQRAAGVLPAVHPPQGRAQSHRVKYQHENSVRSQPPSCPAKKPSQYPHLSFKPVIYASFPAKVFMQLTEAEQNFISSTYFRIVRSQLF